MKMKNRYFTLNSGKKGYSKRNNFFQSELPGHLQQRAGTAAMHTRKQLSSARNIRSDSKQHHDDKFEKVKYESK